MKNQEIIIQTTIYENYRISSSTNELVKLIEINKNNIDKLLDINSKIQGLYFLVNYCDNCKKIYIGESQDIADRMRDHIKNKDFAKVYIFWLQGDFNLSYWKYLEYYYIKKWENSDFLENKKTQKEPDIDSFGKHKIGHYINIIDEFINFLNINEWYKNKNNNLKSNEMEIDIIEPLNNFQSKIFYFDNSKLKLQIINGKKEWLLLKGSEISINNLDENFYEKKEHLNKNSKYQKFMNSLIKNQNYKIDNNKIILIDDLQISSCSLAAEIVRCYRAYDGWMEWKDQNGVSIKLSCPEIYNKK